MASLNYLSRFICPFISIKVLIILIFGWLINVLTQRFHGLNSQRYEQKPFRPSEIRLNVPLYSLSLSLEDNWIDSVEALQQINDE